MVALGRGGVSYERGTPAGGELRLGAESVKGHVCERPAIRRVVKCAGPLFGKCQDQASGEGHASEDLSRMPHSGCGRAVSVSIKETVGSGRRMHRA